MDKILRKLLKFDIARVEVEISIGTKAMQSHKNIYERTKQGVERLEIELRDLNAVLRRGG